MNMYYSSRKGKKDLEVIQKSSRLFPDFKGWGHLLGFQRPNSPHLKTKGTGMVCRALGTGSMPWGHLNVGIKPKRISSKV